MSNNHWIKQNKPERQSMGIGPIGEPTQVFVRKFRWTLSADTLDSYFIKSVHIDFHNKVVRFDCYEVVDTSDKHPEIDIQKWAETDVSKEIMTLATYDGCGVTLYEYKFYDLEIAADKAEFDYSDNDASFRTLTVKYSRYERSVLRNMRYTKDDKEEKNEDRTCKNRHSRCTTKK